MYSKPQKNVSWDHLRYIGETFSKEDYDRTVDTQMIQNNLMNHSKRRLLRIPPLKRLEFVYEKEEYGEHVLGNEERFPFSTIRTPIRYEEKEQEQEQEEKEEKRERIRIQSPKSFSDGNEFGIDLTWKNVQLREHAKKTHFPDFFNF